MDGHLDGYWRGNPLGTVGSSYDTPARLPYETRLVERLISREGFGRDAVPDLLFVNHKLIDHIGHRYSARSIEMHDTVQVQDRQLGELVRFLNHEVGRGRAVRWPHPAVSVGSRPSAVRFALVTAMGTPNRGMRPPT